MLGGDLHKKHFNLNCYVKKSLTLGQKFRFNPFFSTCQNVKKPDTPNFQGKGLASKTE